MRHEHTLSQFVTQRHDQSGPEILLSCDWGWDSIKTALFMPGARPRNFKRLWVTLCGALSVDNVALQFRILDEVVCTPISSGLIHIQRHVGGIIFGGRMTICIGIFDGVFSHHSHSHHIVGGVHCKCTLSAVWSSSAKWKHRESD